MILNNDKNVNFQCLFFIKTSNRKIKKIISIKMPQTLQIYGISDAKIKY